MTTPPNSSTPAASPAAALPRVPLARLPLAGALIACGSLALSLALGPHASEAPIALLSALCILVLLWALVQRVAALARSGAAMQLAVAVAGLGFATVLGLATLVIAGSQLGLAVWATLAGAGLTGVAGRRIRARAVEAGTPWQRIAGGAGRQREAQAAATDLVLLLIGGTVLVAGLAVGWSFVHERLSAISAIGAHDLIYLAVTGLSVLTALAVGLALVGWFWRLLMGGRALNARGVAPRAAPAAPAQRDEATVAAHLHDSVLQTLALIGRNAEDPARVQQLARQQERSLRAWLAGRDETAASTLAAAVRAVGREVEDEQPGVVIEVVTVGDAPLDRPADAMVRAAREAVRNAARHAGSPVRVFLEVDADVRELYVRDTGGGFVLAEVDEERRGVRDAIIGRMEHIGGEAEIDSGPTGTEVALRCTVERQSGKA